MIGIRSLLLAGLAVSALAACSDPKFDDSSQFGANPVLPKPKQFLVPPINVAPGPGWEKGHTPDVAAGLEVKPLATGLTHPRFLYVLPNGDILVVQAKPPPEPVKKPKDIVFNWVWGSAATSKGAAQPASKITLVRDANGDAKPELETTLLDNLNAPFGVTWVDGTL